MFQMVSLVSRINANTYLLWIFYSMRQINPCVFQPLFCYWQLS